MVNPVGPIGDKGAAAPPKEGDRQPDLQKGTNFKELHQSQKDTIPSLDNNSRQNAEYERDGKLHSVGIIDSGRTLIALGDNTSNAAKSSKDILQEQLGKLIPENCTLKINRPDDTAHNFVISLDGKVTAFQRKAFDQAYNQICDAISNNPELHRAAMDEVGKGDVFTPANTDTSPNASTAQASSEVAQRPQSTDTASSAWYPGKPQTEVSGNQSTYNAVAGGADRQATQHAGNEHSHVSAPSTQAVDGLGQVIKDGNSTRLVIDTNKFGHGEHLTANVQESTYGAPRMVGKDGQPLSAQAQQDVLRGQANRDAVERDKWAYQGSITGMYNGAPFKITAGPGTVKFIPVDLPNGTTVGCNMIRPNGTTESTVGTMCDNDAESKERRKIPYLSFPSDNGPVRMNLSEYKRR